jgi:hypothetical protein
VALRKVTRFRAPIDGSWFRTQARLNGILRATTGYDDINVYPSWVDKTTVPIWVSMRPYKAQETRKNPSGMMFGPVVKVGATDAPEVEMFGHHWAAGLSYDDVLRGDWGGESLDRWIYHPDPSGNPLDARGEDASFYVCDKCEQTLYRDERGERSHNSATIFNGSLVCRDCDVTGLVMDADAEKQLMRCYALANHVGEGLPDRLARMVDRLAGGFSFGSPCQTRLFKSDDYSFNWSTTVFTEEGKRRGMNGGLIQFGPHPKETGVDGYTFRQWDYSLKAERDATPEEVANISWSIHT